MAGLEMQKSKIPSEKTCDIENSPNLKEAQVGLFTLNASLPTPAPGDGASFPADVFWKKEGISRFGAKREDSRIKAKD